MPLKTASTIAPFTRTGPVIAIAEGEWENEQAVPIQDAWIQDEHAIEPGCRHPSYPDRICTEKKAERHAFGFWQAVARFVVERYRFDYETMQSVLIHNSWDGPEFDSSS
jgi:hypothetical protein